MARLRSSVPELFVYFVKLASIARCAAAPMCAGVGKSGSPAPKSTMSIPWDFIFMASDATFMVGDCAIRPARADRLISLGPQGLAPLLLLAEAIFDNGRYERRHGAAERDDLLDEARADVGVGFGGHHEDRFDLGIEVPVHQRHLHFVFEVGNHAAAADDHAGPLPSRVLDEEAVQGVLSD